MKRTHSNGELTIHDINKRVVLMGWVHTRRDHGGVIFVDLRDGIGMTQIVFNPKFAADVHNQAEALKREDVIAVEGIVKQRSKDQLNKAIITGEIEVFIEKLEIITRAHTPPIEIDDRKPASDEKRLKYRYLDLRRPIMQRNLRMRHQILTSARDYLNTHDFIEVETPLLVKPTPEGARDYLVPSRVSPGHFYALPQSPQLYKQILMIAGIGRYYQIARCLRDEDLRADRQPEFTQIDLEMSFVDEKDIMGLVEGLYKHIFRKNLGIEFDSKFQVLTYRDAMERYGSDKPDLRFGLELHDVTSIVKESDYSIFKEIISKGGIVKCLNPEGELGRNELDELIEYAKELGAKGLSWMRVTEEGLESNITKYFSREIQEKIIKAVKARPGSILLYIADKEAKANELLSKLRAHLAEKLGLIDEKKFCFCWVTEFPLFEYDSDLQAWKPMHHMFTMPTEETIPLLEKDPGKVIGKLFDLVLNGTELASGSMRIHDTKLQERVMSVIGMSKEEAHSKFGFLLEAYKYGAPMHGGMGLGFDRTVALMLGYSDIREVIAFPKNKAAECPMDSSPGEIEKGQLKELHLKLDIVKQPTQ